MVQQTSIEAYGSIRNELVGRQKQVYKLIKAMQPVNNRQISSACHLPINSITLRVKELREKGLVKAYNTGMDDITSRRTIFWQVVE